MLTMTVLAMDNNVEQKKRWYVYPVFVLWLSGFKFRSTIFDIQQKAMQKKKRYHSRTG